MLAFVGGLLLLILAYQFYFSGPTPRPSLQANRNQPAANAKSAPTVQTPEAAEKLAANQTTAPMNQEEAMKAMLEDMTPLNVSYSPKGGDATVSPRGNIFEYYVPPPPPPGPPTPPPPISLLGVSPQSATAGTPRSFTLTIYGKAFPADAVIFMDGSERPTNRVNETTLTTEMKAADYASPRNSTVEVKSRSDQTHLFSNQQTFVAVPAPEPPFKFIGLLGDQAIFEINNTKEYVRLRVGGTIQGVWRIDAISTQAVEVTHTQFDIKKNVPLQDKGR